MFLHNYMGVPVYAFYLPKKFLLDNAGARFRVQCVKYAAACQPPGTLVREWVRANDAANCDWEPSTDIFTLCRPTEFLAQKTDEATTARSHVYEGELFVETQKNPGLGTARDGRTVVFLACEKTSAGNFLMFVAGLEQSPSVEFKANGKYMRVSFSSLVPNIQVSQLSCAQKTCLQRATPRRALFPAPAGEVSCAQLGEFVDSLVAFCVRWHCHVTARGSADPAVNAWRQWNMHRPTDKFFVGTSARAKIFASPTAHAAMNVIQLLSRSATLRTFTRSQIASAVQYICESELLERSGAEQAAAAHEFLAPLAKARFSQQRPGECDIAPLDMRVDGDVLSYSLFALSAELDDLLLPDERLLGHVTVNSGRVRMRPEAAVRAMSVALRRFYESMVPLEGGALARLDRELKDRGFDCTERLSVYDDALPLVRGLYAADRPLRWDERVARTPHQEVQSEEFSVPRAAGLERTREELLQPPELAHTFHTRDGEVPVPTSALETLLHTEAEAQHHLADFENPGSLHSSLLRKSGAYSNHSQVPEHEYARDPDGSTVRDQAFRTWLSDHVRETAARRERRRQQGPIEIGTEDADDSEYTPVSRENSSSADEVDEAELFASTGSSCASDDVEDFFVNIYNNAGMPLCQSGYARANIEGNEHPKDKARVNYYPYLRSLEMPGVSSRQVVAHMMRNVEPSKFGHFFRRFAAYGPQRCKTNWERSKDGLMRSGRPEHEAERMATVSRRCGSMQRDGTCPFATAGTERGRTELRGKLRDAGVDLQASEEIVRTAAQIHPGAACKKYFVHTRPVYGARSGAERVAPFPPGHDPLIKHPREYTYLAAVHMEASLRSPKGYKEGDFSAGEV